VTLLRQIEVEIANGETTPQACKETQFTAQTYYGSRAVAVSLGFGKLSLSSSSFWE
jgi:hypothetical protein